MSYSDDALLVAAAGAGPGARQEWRVRIGAKVGGG
eukprot:gene974-56656_t